MLLAQHPPDDLLDRHPVPPAIAGLLCRRTLRSPTNNERRGGRNYAFRPTRVLHHATGRDPRPGVAPAPLFLFACVRCRSATVRFRRTRPVKALVSWRSVQAFPEAQPGQLRGGRVGAPALPVSGHGNRRPLGQPRKLHRPRCRTESRGGRRLPWVDPRYRRRSKGPGQRRRLDRCASNRRAQPPPCAPGGRRLR